MLWASVRPMRPVMVSADLPAAAHLDSLWLAAACPLSASATTTPPNPPPLAAAAHTIKNPKTRMAKACHALKADRRWAVTGTPLQNSLQVRWYVCSVACGCVYA